MLTSRWGWVTSVLVGAVLASAGCSKTNNVSQQQTVDVGEQCGGKDDPGCGVNAVCTLGFCRTGCTTDLECPQGAICVGDKAPFGCSLPAELACSSAQPCESPGLSCGIDGVCRLPCQTDTDCPRNEHSCIAKSCVGKSEKGFAAWSCTTGNARCQGPALLECNTIGPGERETSNCGDGVCTLPNGQCLEPVIAATNAPQTDGSLELIDGELYWLDNEGNLLKSGTEPGAKPEAAFELPPGEPTMRQLVGPLLGVLEDQNGVLNAHMFRAIDGTELVSVTGPQGSSGPAVAMPSAHGLYWAQKVGGDHCEVFWAALNATEATSLGTIPDEALQGSCATDSAVYFRGTNGNVYRASADGVIDVGVTAQATPLCGDDFALLPSSSNLIRLDDDGTQTPIIEGRMAQLAFLGDRLFAISENESTFLEANLVTGEVREILSLALPSYSHAPFKLDDTYAYFLGPKVMRTKWE